MLLYAIVKGVNMVWPWEVTHTIWGTVPLQLFQYTVWSEMLAGRYLADCWKYVIWRNLLWRLSQSSIFITKWLIERTGNLTGPWASLEKLMMNCNWKLDKSLFYLISTVFVASVFTATAYPSFGSPSSRWQTSQLFSHLRCTKLFGEVMSSYAAFNGELHADD